MAAAKIGRPPKPDDEQAVVVRLEKRHVEMLDAAIVDDLKQRDMLTLPALIQEGRQLEPLTPHRIANERRRFLGALIEQRLSFEARHPTRFNIEVAIAGTTEADLREAGAWTRTHNERLTADAPPAIQRAFERNTLLRLQRDDPEKFQAMMRGMLAKVAADERSDP